MTRRITAAATMTLGEECKRRLAEPVDALLPELAERKMLKRLDGPLDDTVPANRPIMVRDLLTFRMGFGQMMAPPITSPPERVTYPILQAASEQQIGMGPPSPSSMPAPDEWMRRLGSLPLMHQPGKQWMDNTGSETRLCQRKGPLPVLRQDRAMTLRQSDAASMVANARHRH